MGEWFPHLRAMLGPRQAKPAQRHALLRLIAVAAEERLPLALLLGAWSYDERGAQRLRLRRLAGAMQKGVSLPDALERYPGALNDEETLLVRFASESGTLAATIRGRLATVEDNGQRLNANLQRASSYLTAILLIVGFLFLLLLASVGRWATAPFVVFTQSPLHMVIEDYGQPVPLATTLADSVNSIALTAVVVLLATLVITRWFRWPARLFRRRIAPRLSSTLRSRRIAEVLQRLGESATAGRPLSGAISTLARHHYEPALRHKLLFVRNELSLGAELWPTLQTVGMLTPKENAALATSNRLGDVGWTLSALAEVRRRHALRRMTWLSSLLLPAIVLALGGFVLVHALSLFTFFTQMITTLA